MISETASSNMDQAQAEPVCQYDISWRWLKHSGLASLMSAAVWLTWRDIVEADHQTMAMPSYRRGKDRRIFRLAHGVLLRTTGLGQSTITRACRYLATTDLLSYYRPGSGVGDGRSGRWTEFGVNTDTLKRLYAYVAPRLPTICGGIWGLSRRQLPDRGVRIYGLTQIGSVFVTWENLSSIQIWADAQDEPAGIDLEEVTRICAL